MRLHLARLARDERGTSLIEFGLLIPFLGLLTMGVIDLSNGLAERFALQQAVNRSLELVQARPAVTSLTSSQVDYTFVEVEAQAAAGTDAVVKLDRWLECNGVETTAATCATGQDTARYLRLTITRNFEGDFYFATVPMKATGALRVQ